MKILIKFPSRGRPARFFDSLDSIYNNLQNPDNVFVLATLDLDDESMNNDFIKGMLGNYKNLKVDWGESYSKIHAINKGMDNIEVLHPEAADWDVVMVQSDDMQFCFYGFDEIVRTDMKTLFGGTDGYLHYWEKDSHTALNVMTIMGRKYYERFGFLYDPRFKSLFCDNVQMEIAKRLGKYAFINLEIFKHFNPAYGYKGFEKD
ncbi:MAG TPA: hypothetical protein VFM18_02295, partial [Methanosarcina sp.]|nr:hypothetical protein [Methanosarcina sp.]